jgi:ATP/maltotriose-dependent transcriptional regulator MalT
LTALIAPAGSGKTTLLGTWLEIQAARRPVAWVSLDEGDNDAGVLWSHVLESLRRVCPALHVSREPETVDAARMIDAFLPDLVNGLTEQDDAALVLDDFHRLSGPSRDSVAWLVEHAPPSFQLVVSTRTEPGLPLAALRAHGELLEVRADELAFTEAEADVFLNDRLELSLGGGEVDELVDRTEGWPAGLYLAALSLRGAEDRHAFVDRFDGNSRGVVDFFVDEVLEAHDPAMQTLMLRCSVLERLCGPLCDAVLEQEGSAQQLRELARTNLFLLPLDDNGHWYRFHHLFATLLRAELEHREPGLAPVLHRRLAEWHRKHRSTGEKVEHARDARAAGDVSDRELTILRALTGPLSERNIARELYLSHNTVHSHTRSIFRKLDVCSRADAVRRGRELGLI